MKGGSEEKPTTLDGVGGGRSNHEHKHHHNDGTSPSNEYVLNIAFASFLGFTLLQFLFALTAKSEAMMADCAAMTVDCLTYLVNYCAEHQKHAPLQELKKLPHELLHRRRRLRRLFLELVPPLISVVTLVVVTIQALTQAIRTLRKSDRDIRDPPDVQIMLIFSALNLLLDGLNVTCFARVEDNVMGLPTAVFHHDDHDCGTATEMTGLLEADISNEPHQTYSATDNEIGEEAAAPDDEGDSMSDCSSDISEDHLNLNMCSAWTHICADTLRSVAVLIAAGFACLFPHLLSPADADSCGAILVSVIIIVSLGPLVQGLGSTAMEIFEMIKEGE